MLAFNFIQQVLRSVLCTVVVLAQRTKVTVPAWVQVLPTTLLITVSNQSLLRLLQIRYSIHRKSNPEYCSIE
jgi:hypothetical protein